jgi:hypothetical protein
MGEEEWKKGIEYFTTNLIDAFEENKKGGDYIFPQVAIVNDRVLSELRVKGRYDVIFYYFSILFNTLWRENRQPIINYPTEVKRKDEGILQTFWNKIKEVFYYV